ncbi:glycosyltransferase [Halomontanus rarus]|uniref:glycosyltransferase n=1 Tax=Halomontanus rarus TaxID=3034020 RepID=UPI0023E8C2A4|nr:glycosyltransferase [Halovivax sp. TS33]
MDIHHISNFFEPAWEAGGVANAASQIAKQQSYLGHYVKSTTTSGFLNEDFSKQDNQSQVNAQYLPTISDRLTEEFLFPMPYKGFSKLRSDISQADIVHIHEHRSPLAAISSIIANREDVPTILQPHGSLGYDRGRRRAKVVFDHAIGNWILQNSSRYIATSEPELRELTGFGVREQKVDIIPIGINEDEVPTDLSGRNFKLKYQIPTNKKLILFLGRLDGIKGLPLLLQAISMIMEVESSDCHLAIVGPENDHQKKLKNMAEELEITKHVTFPGPVYGDEKYDAYDAADLYVLPSHFESFSTTVLEAGIVGTPVLVSENCWISSLLDEFDEGFTFKRTQRELASHINELLYNENKRRSFSTNFKQRIKDVFTWEKIAINTIESYEEIISG